MLREMNLSSGRKIELINRLMEANPSRKWMESGSAKESTEEAPENEGNDTAKREVEIYNEKQILRNMKLPS